MAVLVVFWTTSVITPSFEFLLLFPPPAEFAHAGANAAPVRCVAKRAVQLDARYAGAKRRQSRASGVLVLWSQGGLKFSCQGTPQENSDLGRG